MSYDTLRVTGRARGVGHRDGIPFIFRPLQLSHRLVPGQHRLVVTAAQRLAATGIFTVQHVYDGRRTTIFVAQDPQRLPHDGAELPIGDHHCRLAMLHLPGQQSRVQPGIERVEHRSCSRDRVVNLDHLRRVGQHDAHCRAASHSQRAQRGRQARGTFSRLAPAIAAVPMNDRGQIAEHFRASLDETERRERDVVGRSPAEILVVDAHRQPPGSLAVFAQFALPTRLAYHPQGTRGS